MSDATMIVRDCQRLVREELDKRGIPLKLVAARAGIPYATLCTYFPGNERQVGERQPAQLPVGALHALCGALPDDLLNLLFPDGWAIVRVPAGIDYDEISQRCRDLIDAKDQAHHPESEAGRDLGPTEKQVLAHKAVKLRVVA